MTPALAAAVDRLRAGGIVAFPTETVYGLGADASNPLAVRQVFAAKGRPADHPLIVHVADAEQAAGWGDLGPEGWRLARRFWPGPLTLVVRRADHVLDEVTGGLSTVGLRVPAHPMALALLRAFGGGIAAPSANRFGRVSPTTADHVREEFGPGVLVLDGGPCSVGLESTIVDVSGPRPALLRPGGVPEEDVAALVGPLTRADTRAPGTLPAHYAPRASLRLSEHPEEDARLLRERGLRVAVLRAAPAEAYARALYAELRRLDASGVDVLVAERAPGGGLGAAINDRLLRASRAVPPEEP